MGFSHRPYRDMFASKLYHQWVFPACEVTLRFNAIRPANLGVFTTVHVKCANPVELQYEVIFFILSYLSNYNLFNSDHEVLAFLCKPEPH